MIEQKLKQLLGEYSFTIVALQAQVDELKKEIEELKCKQPTKKQ
jgi:hypothetical protein